MKNLLKSLFIIAMTTVITSCNADDVLSEIEENQNSTEQFTYTKMTPLNPMGATIYEVELCSGLVDNGRYKYAIYAYDSKSYLTLPDYDRTFTAHVIQNNVPIKVKSLKIKAGQRVSESIPIFETDQNDIGNVSIEIFAIQGNNQDLTEPDTYWINNAVVKNCYQSNSSADDLNDRLNDLDFFDPPTQE